MAKCSGFSDFRNSRYWSASAITDVNDVGASTTSSPAFSMLLNRDL